MSNYLKKSLSLLAGLHAVNTLIDVYAKNVEKHQEVRGSFYDWRNGKIFYKVKGRGKPLLLIHNLDHRFASYEWDEIIAKLSKNHKVFTIDLSGCGRSDKPKSVYTSYLYVQLIRDFIKNIIKEKTDIIASHDSSPFMVMVNHLYPDLINKLILINPPEVACLLETDILKKAYMKLLFTPVIGTSVYNAENLSALMFLSKVIELPINESTIINSENAYVASHYKRSNGRFLYASKVNNYLSVDIKKQLENSKNITAIFSVKNPNTKDAMSDYSKLKKTIAIKKISAKSLYPHRDNAQSTAILLSSIIS